MLRLTGAPLYLWHCQMGRYAWCSWNLRRRGFHRCPMPEPQVPAACYLGLDHYSWGTRCSCAARSPWQWRSQGAAERWTGSPHCLCKECLEDTMQLKGFEQAEVKHKHPADVSKYFSPWYYDECLPWNLCTLTFLNTTGSCLTLSRSKYNAYIFADDSSNLVSHHRLII